ncbi:hypothetical protein F511_26695 [Dorcoceras hygrometricum]|uniref:Uncharacterized protein n=1 Tax=Dorcoceras hygrometricum TaxID=472368 RepID=A0A2Z7BEA0_9LAMI|nr:hypothetical protein F511_26695 [Dorcoceras hygrometricum]
MKTSSNKRPSRKHDRKVLVAEESTKSWADSDSESSSSSSSSSDSEQEEVHCLMADQMDDDEVFDFSNVEFKREDLVQALNDMVHEYKTLSHTFEEIKAENASLKNSSAESSSDELEDADSLNTELSKLRIENELLRSESSELKAEVEKLTNEMSSWTQSARAFHKLQEIQKSAHDRTGLGFSNSESSEGETSTKSQPVYDKFNKMGFVKADVIYDCCESIRYDDQKPSQSSHEGKGKDGIGYQRPESSKPSWLKNRMDKDKAKAGSKSYVPNQQRRNFRKAKYGWKKTWPRRDPVGQNVKSKLHRSHNFAQTFVDPKTGKTVKEEDTAAGGDPPADKVDEEVPWFVRPFIRADRDTERLFETASGSEDAMDVEVESQDLPVVRDTDVSTVGEQEKTAFGEQLMGTNDESSEDIKAEEPVEKSVDEFIDDDEEEIKILEVNERTWFLNSLPKIPAENKGKAILVEKDPMKGNPAQEHYFLICADIDLLVDLRAKVIDEVAQFFNSFSLKKLATINIEEMYKKEEQVLSWGETESPQLAIQRKLYIFLKYREVLVRKFLESWRSNFVPGQGSSAVDLRVIDLLSDLHLFILEELTKEARAHGLSWKKPCCYEVFEGETRDHGAVIARSNTSTRSSCWIRTMLRVDGSWIVESCADRWVKIPRQIISCEVHRQRQYDDTLPSVRDFFRLLKKRWEDVCLEVVAFCSSRRLLPVGFVNFCRGLPVGEPVFRVAPRHSPVFAFRVSQFCSVFIDFSLFSWLPTADITVFLSSIALNRTAFRSEQISQNTVSVAPSVQLSLVQPQSSPTSANSSSSLHFDTTDLDATVSSLPPVSIDLSAALVDFQAILSEQINEYQSGISSRLHKIEQSLRDSLRKQAEVFKNLFQGARQEGRTIDDVQTLRFNEFRKNILAQNASIFTGLADVRKEVQEVNAKVDIIASGLNDVRKNVEETKEAIFSPTSGISNRGPQQPPNVQIRDSGTDEDSAVRTPTFAQRVEMAQRRIIESVLDADRNSESLERQAAAERDRERRIREARLLKRRRRF